MGSINKEKKEAYIKEYVTNGFNKTKALEEVSNQTYQSANDNCTRFHNRVTVDNGIMLEIDNRLPMALKVIDDLLANCKKESIKADLSKFILDSSIKRGKSDGTISATNIYNIIKQERESNFSKGTDKPSRDT